MVDPFERFPIRQTVFTLFVLFVLGASTVEIVSELADGETLDAMADDVLRAAFGVVVLGVFVHEYRVQQRALSELRGQLDKARGQLPRIDGKAAEIANQFSAVMKKQFDAWNLTASEQDAVVGMLKGLTFREIVSLRGTREKTVRQQASSVYSKAGVASRNELAAWFFEDMLEPLESSSREATGAL